MPPQAQSTTLTERVRAHWHAFSKSKPGQRFQDRYRRRREEGHGLLAKALNVGAGLLLFILGLVLIPAPGPGFLVVFVGAGMIAEESYIAARALDWTELRLRAFAVRATRFWRSSAFIVKILVVLLGISAIVLAALLAWFMVF